MGPTPGPTCGPAGLVSQMVFPVPQSTGVLDALPVIVVAVSSPLPINTYDLALSFNNGASGAYTANYLAQITASQLPAGSAPTSIPNPVYEAVNLIAVLPSATQVQIGINNPYDPNNCTPITVPNGTFKTQ